LWSESDKLQDGEIMPLSVANRVFEELDTAQHTDREKDGYTGGWYDKTAFRIDFTLNGQPDNYEGRQDFGDGEGSLVQHIQNYHEYYAKDENWKNFVLHNKGPEAWEQDKAEREMVLTEFIPYLKQHCNLSAMEQAATAALREGQNISPEQAAYYNTVVTYVQDCRPLLNQGQYDLPEPPKLAGFDQSLQDYKAQVQAEIAQEAAAAGMTVEEYAAAGFEAPQQDSFSIYQLRNEDSTRDYRFEPYDRLQAAGWTVDKANYTEVYAAPLAAGTTLEDIYRTFNVDHPADFKGHSLSVSDVVVLHQNGQDTAHYCDSVGFQQVPEFLRENPLRTAELSTEQNENMIDGVLNNAPSLGELEAKAKAGEQISLTDLAAAVKAEEKAPKAKKSRAAKPKKPSIRAQLDAAKKEQSKQTQPREKTKELEV
ncbi:MAG: YodL domain-containing protein, partial [Faecalibacterium prausnitzii]